MNVRVAEKGITTANLWILTSYITVEPYKFFNFVQNLSDLSKSNQIVLEISCTSTVILYKLAQSEGTCCVARMLQIIGKLLKIAKKTV